MRNIETIVSKQFIAALIANLSAIGITENNIECILLEGSALYLENPNDLDFKVIVKFINPKAELGRSFDIVCGDGETRKVECTFYTFKKWGKQPATRKLIYYVTESPDMITVYGNDAKFVRHDILTNRELARKVLLNYDKSLFNYVEENKKQGYQPMLPKRLWNFLLFAYKLKNNSHEVTNAQLETIQDAHDLKLELEDYRSLFNEITALLG